MPKLKIVATSDFHGTLPEIIDPADIAIIAGDVSPFHIQFNKPACKVWFETEFADWIKRLPVDEVFMTPGNHDAYMENIATKNLSALRIACEGKLKILFNESAVYIDSYGLQWTIFGTPYCHEFGQWPFMRTENSLKDKFKKIPDKVDIIISHDPPFGISDADITFEVPANNYMHLGNEPLAARLFNVNYKILFCGHLHTGDHRLNPYSRIVNVSYWNEHCDKSFLPFYTEIEHDLV